MIQAPFGSTTPGWTGFASPLFAWPPGPIAMANPAMGFGAQDPITTTQPLTWTGGGGLPVTTGPLSTPLVVPQGVMAPVLMATIAARRGLPQGPTSDHDVEELLYDATELLPGAADVEVRCEGGRVTLTGSVPHKRIKHDLGELAWAIPAINDVQNTLNISGRRRSRGLGREPEAQPAGQGRKQA